MRIDVLRSQVKSGSLSLKEGFPDVPDNWREIRRQAMGSNLTCVQMYFRDGETVDMIAAKFDVSGSLVRNRLRDGLKFLRNHNWLVAADPPAQCPPGLPSSAGSGLSPEPKETGLPDL